MYYYNTHGHANTNQMPVTQPTTPRYMKNNNFRDFDISSVSSLRYSQLNTDEIIDKVMNHF